MPIPRSDKPSWPTHWPWSCQHHTHCIQQIPYTPIWCTLRTHHLAARSPWCLPPQGKIILVHCRHPWSHHPWSTLKWETSSCEDELCHHHQTTQHSSCFHYSGHKQACYSPWSSQAHQVHWWLDQWISRSVQGNLADSPANTKSDTIMMHILWYMPPGNAPLPYIRRSRSTSTRWNA